MSVQKLLQILIFTCLFASTAEARKLEQVFDDWHVLTTNKNNEKVCYIASIPKEETGNFKKRNDPYLLVSKFPDRKPEISISAGYNYKSGSEVEITIAKRQFKLEKIQQAVAWAGTEAIDQQIIMAMKAGVKLESKSISNLDSYSVDVYSLKGFTKAFNTMVTLCSQAEQESANAEEAEEEQEDK